MLRQAAGAVYRAARVAARDHGVSKRVLTPVAGVFDRRGTAAAQQGATRGFAATPEDVDPDVADFDKPQVRTVGSEKVFRIADEVLNLSMLEAHDLMEILKERLGITDAMMNGFGSAPAAGGGGGAEAAAPAAEEKTDFDIKLEGFDASSKIKLIKEIRGVTDLGLKEAKELVESAPCVIKKGLKKEDAEAVLEKLKAVGGTVVME
mmetsp:Transcript_245/g.521  ORF Transcript_245/g.521 Transcript_245/m.521 type:complete len:206 (-) Transcript_245:183-800(-)|eukprot:CAMPEP_0182856466 /NCGR_PEP_ID=MMETSP0034_2-20130328/2454_1 /TAXON_ID=156128 /ORGANISM="Nephroselmis pyriformis, Strain CCMP717" /LENGTH=205 /DNA_ID=CAMNT_0024987545 /DNA_START=219 /DNA_END=836 /DNA_ORIENTATION=-